MGTIVIFPQDRVVRTVTRSSRVEELEIRILDLLLILRHRKSDKTVAEILKLREEIWRLEADDGEAFSENASPPSH